MDKVKKNFGFGCMRLPMIGEEVDLDQFSKMTDEFLEAGFNYFDTAHGYLNGKSETAIRECLVNRHSRDQYLLTNKLSGPFFTKEEDIRPLFETQLEACGVEYFDFYLMHAQNAKVFEKFKSCRAYETALELKEEGKIRHVGISFHDKAAVLEQILTEYPQIEVVQIQFNYVDYEDLVVESGKCYEVCRKFGKPVIVMEPVKGGSLVNLPEEAEKVFADLNGGSNASYAIRFAAGFEGMMMVLSGMSDLDQLRDNIGYMKEFKPLTEEEMNAVNKVQRIFRAQDWVSCTACHYCTDGCPQNIPIPEIFGCLNAKNVFKSQSARSNYLNFYTVNRGKASDCVKCGQCEKICPQQLKITEILEKAVKEFED